MKEHYTYDEIYGTLIHRNEDDTERTYFIVECLTYSLYRWMFKHGWNKVGENKITRNNILGTELTIKLNIDKGR